ncbi:MAG TPA: hypothetical protein PLV68_10560, partial [Ilumatobacteraceae bacterium]|nr:hypothetical protein [Ilumatobacteraceae bacterium]
MAHTSPVTCLDHHPASGVLITGGYDGRVIATHDGHELWVATFPDLVNDVRVDDRGTRVAVAVADYYAYVLDAATGWIMAALGPHGDDVNVVRWMPSTGQPSTGQASTDRLVCTMDHHDPTVRIWTHADGAWTCRTLAHHDSGVFGAAVSPDGSCIATAAEDGTARIWDTATGTELHVL